MYDHAQQLAIEAHIESNAGKALDAIYNAQPRQDRMKFVIGYWLAEAFRAGALYESKRRETSNA